MSVPWNHWLPVPFEAHAYVLWKLREILALLKPTSHFPIYHGLNCVLFFQILFFFLTLFKHLDFFKFLCWTPTTLPQYFRLWPYLGMGTLWKQLKSYWGKGGILIYYSWCLYWNIGRINLDKSMNKGNTMCETERVKEFLCKLRNSENLKKKKKLAGPGR